jgi:hypothetical protein
MVLERTGIRELNPEDEYLGVDESRGQRETIRMKCFGERLGRSRANTWIG